MTIGTFTIKMTTDVTNGNYLTVVETGGTYNTISAYAVTITTPLNNTYSYDIFADADYANLGTTGITITSEKLISSTGGFEDGEYTFLFTITDADGTSTKTEVKLFFNNVECCVKTNLAEITLSCTEIKPKDKIWLIASAHLEALHAQSCLGQSERALVTLAQLQNICNNIPCKPCGCD